MASTTYEREASELAQAVADELSERTGHTVVVEGSTWRTKYLRIVDTTGKWKIISEFTGSRWEDVYHAIFSAWQLVGYIKES